MFQLIRLAFKFSLISSFVALNTLPSLAEIPITGGEVRGSLTLDSDDEVIDGAVTSFILDTPRGQLASPSTTFSDPRNVIGSLFGSGSATVNLSGTAFTPSGDVVMFSGVPTIVNGRLDQSSIVGADTLNPSGRFIIDSGTFNLGNTTISGNGNTYQDSTLSFDVILPDTDLNPEPGPVIEIPGIDESPTNSPTNNPNKPEDQSIQNRIKEQRISAEREQSALQSRLNELAMQKTAAVNKQATLEDKLEQLERQKNISERQNQALNNQLNNYKFQETNINDEIELLKEKIELLRKNKTKAESKNDILRQREQKLLDSINNLVKDKTLENETQRLEDEMNAFGGKVDDVQKAVLFINGIRRSIFENGKKGIFTYVLDEITPEGYKLPDGFSPTNTPIKDINKKTKIITFNPWENLTKFVEQEVKASNIADWVSGASKAIADAKLQISEQKADAMDKLRAALKETRALIKQNQEYITQAEQEITELQSEVSNRQNQLNQMSQKIQEVQSKTSENDQEIAQINQSIQQTQNEIITAQQKERQAEVEAKEIKQQQIDATNTSVIGRSNPMPSNILPVTSMNQ